MEQGELVTVVLFMISETDGFYIDIGICIRKMHEFYMRIDMCTSKIHAFYIYMHRHMT